MTSDGDTPDTVADRSPPPTPPDEHISLGGHLHPSVIVLWSVRTSALLVALWVAGSMERAVGLVLLGVILGTSWVRWRRFTWRVDAEGLVIEQGLLERKRRMIPIERIQAVQAVRKVRHRVFGVVGLRIEAIGGSETEGQLDALTPGVARRVQQALLRRPGPAGAAPTPSADGVAPTRPYQPSDVLVADTPPGTVLASCPPRMLLVAGLTGGRVGVAAALIGLAQEIYGDRVTSAVLSAPERLGVTVALLLVVGVVLAVFILSVAATAVAYWDFTLRRDGPLLRLQRGLLDERRDTVPLARVQSVTVEQNVLRRLFGLASVKMVVAGRAGDDGDLTSTLLPIGRKSDALRLVGEVFDAAALDRVDLTPMPPGARSRRLARALAASALVTAVVALTVGWSWALAGVASAAVTVPIALASYRALGWALPDGMVVGRSGWLVRRTSVTPADATQSARLSSSPFQRRRGLATLRLEIARARGTRDPRLLDIAADDGARVQHRLAEAVAGSEWEVSA